MDLKQIDVEVNALTSAAGDPSAKAHLLERIARTPQAPAAKEAAPRRPFPWLRSGAYLTGAAALFVFGWLLGRSDVPEAKDPVERVKTVQVEREKLVDVIRDKLIPVYSSAERDLVAALVRRNARLVQAPTVNGRLDTLLDMADDCRTHVLTMIERGPRDHVPLTIELYGQLLREGVLTQLKLAPAAERMELEKSVRVRLDKLAEPGPFDATTLPRVLEDQHEALQKAAQDALAKLDDPKSEPAAVRKWDRAEPMPATMALVQFALAFSSDADTVAKADLCAACVHRLTPVMLLYFADDASPARAEMGQQFGEMIRFGVYTPLDVATAKEPPQPVQEQADRIRRSTDESIAEMEKNLSKAPAAVRPALERALDAMQKGSEKHKGKGKGKGAGKNSNEPNENNSKVNGKKKTALQLPADRDTGFQPVLSIEATVSRGNAQAGSLCYGRANRL